MRSVICAVLLLLPSLALSQTDRLLPSEHLVGSAGRACGWINRAWVPGSAKGKSFRAYKWELASLKQELKRSTGAAQRRVKKKIVVVKGRIADVSRTLCARLDEPGKAATWSLSRIPNPGALARRNLVGGTAVSGQPPKLQDIPPLGPATVFFRPGFVAAFAAGPRGVAECNEYVGIGSEGQSAGMSACFTAEAVGQVFEPILQSSKSLCFMKKTVTAAAFESGAAVIVSGTPPNEDPSQLFVVPGGSESRVVKVIVNNGAEPQESVFVRVHAAEDNYRRDNLYRFDAWRCLPDSDTPSGYESAAVKQDRSYTSVLADTALLGPFQAEVHAYLADADDGNAVFDSEQERSVITQAAPAPGYVFKNQITLGNDDVMRLKSYSTIAVMGLANAQKAFGVARCSGDSAGELRFVEGAYNNRMYYQGALFRQDSGASEYRDTYYASAPANPLLERVAGLDPADDPFFDTLGSIEVDTAAYSCSEPANIVVEINIAHEAVQGTVGECLADILQRQSFCVDDSVMQQAGMTWVLSCGPLYTH